MFFVAFQGISTMDDPDVVLIVDRYTDGHAQEPVLRQGLGPHDGLLRAYGVPLLPPAVRVTAAHGDPRAGEVGIESKAILS